MAFADAQPACEETMAGMLSRAGTLEAALNEAAKNEPIEDNSVIYNWALRPVAANDQLLRTRFLKVLKESEAAPPHEKLVMYDACDDKEVRATLGAFRKRIDARRNTKPNKPNDQKLVCTPFNPDGFHFGKIKNDRERLVRLALSSGRYDVLTNKFPLFPKHMLLVAGALVPQQMTALHLRAITELLQPTTFCAYFNSWCASASVNHFHCHLIDELPPVVSFPLVAGPLVGGVRVLQPQGFPGFCYVYPVSMLPHVDAAITAMQVDNQPHNLLFTPRHIYVFPKPLARPLRSFELYPETVGGPELIGSFTVYTQQTYDALSHENVEELCRINTAPMPSRLLRRGGAATACVDDAAVHSDSTVNRATSGGLNNISSSRTVDSLPQMRMAPLAPLDSLHSEDWPQDRPIAKALSMTNFVFV